MDKIDTLHEKIKDYISGKRLSHTLSVEGEARLLAGIFGFDEAETSKLSYAALLHDITKQKKTDGQLELYEELSLPDSELDALSPKMMHAKTAAALISRDFPEYADNEIISAVRWHTTGHPDMSLFEKLLYLADYIEPSRTFDDCIRLRKYFYDGIASADNNIEKKIRHLNLTLILSFDMTIRALIKDGELICTDTVEARNYLIRSMLLDRALPFAKRSNQILLRKGTIDVQ